MNIHGLNYHVEVVGEGTPLVLLHGFSGSGADWASFVPALAEQFRVVTVDLPGHGRTDSPQEIERYTMPNTARDLIALFGQLELGPVNLLGYSMGGRLALYLALHDPGAVRALILESASPGLDDEQARYERIASDEALAAQIEENGIDWFADYWGNLPLFASLKTLPSAAQAELHAKRLNNQPRGLANSLRGMGTGVQPSLWPRLGELNMPVLLLAGEKDPKFLSINQQMQTAIQGVWCTLVPGAGHNIHLEQPGLFVRLVTHFLTFKKS